MNGLEASATISKLTERINSTKRILTNAKTNNDLWYEVKILEEIQAEMEQQLSELENKLKSISL